MNPSATSLSTPVTAAERIGTIDTLRGFALLGILLMNIVAMGMYGAAYDNPTIAGGASGANLGVWAALHVLAEGKMRCLFSLVFGASIILLTSRLEGRGDAADIYYRRISWLILFGIAHAYLLWAGDILYPYALCALILYPFRKMTSRQLLVTGFVVLALTSVGYIGKGFGERQMLRKGAAAEADEKAGKGLTDEQTDDLHAYAQWKRFNKPTPELLKKDIEEWRGNPLQVIKARAKVVSFFHSFPYYHPWSWDIWSMMLIGMGLFKVGVLNGELPSAKYAKMALIGYGIGIPVNSYTAWLIIKSNFDPVTQSFTGVAYDIGRLSITLGHVSLILLLCKFDAFGWLTRTLGAVGQMAFSNYILQSVLTAFLFTGYGLKMYGRLERHELYYVVAAVWAVNMIVSPIWLRHFRFGPLEWAWRSLTYWKRQPMRLREAGTKTVVAEATA